MVEEKPVYYSSRQMEFVAAQVVYLFFLPHVLFPLILYMIKGEVELEVDVFVVCG